MCGYLRSFLDTAPEGGEPERVKELIVIVKQYFEKELERAENDRDSTELILATLGAAIRRLPIQEQLEQLKTGIPDSPPVTVEDVERWQRFEDFLGREGKKGWWD